MRFRFLLLPAALVLSACAQPAMLGNLNDCDGQTAPGYNTDPNAAFYSMSHGLPNLGFIVTYESGGSRVKNCAQSRPAPSLHDPSKVGGTPGTAETANARPCPAHRA
jgi:hypothetical protein